MDILINLVLIYVIVGLAVAMLYNIVHVLFKDDEESIAELIKNCLIMTVITTIGWPWVIQLTIKDYANGGGRK